MAVTRIRDECLNEHLFRRRRHARERINHWRMDYNRNQPHGPRWAHPNGFTTRSARNHKMNS
ncbi:MAG: transposase [Rhodobiaceae bacterium]|nr:transposase [Rhodobiaceae bacterium]